MGREAQILENLRRFAKTPAIEPDALEPIETALAVPASGVSDVAALIPTKLAEPHRIRVNWNTARFARTVGVWGAVLSNSHVKIAARIAWTVGFWGAVLSAIVAEALGCLSAPQLTAPETQGWLDSGLSLAVNIGLRCFEIGALGGLIYLRGRIGAWLALLVSQLILIGTAMIVMGIAGAAALAIIGDGGEIRWEIAALLGVGAVCGIIRVAVAITAEMWIWLEKERSKPKVVAAADTDFEIRSRNIKLE